MSNASQIGAVVVAGVRNVGRRESRYGGHQGHSQEVAALERRNYVPQQASGCRPVQPLALELTGDSGVGVGPAVASALLTFPIKPEL